MLETLKTIDRAGLKLAYNVLSELALFITIALAAALCIYAIVIRNRDDEYLAKARKLILGIVIGYAVSVISTIGVLMLMREIMGGLDTGFWLMIGLFALVVVGLAVTLVLMKKKIPAYKWVALGFIIAFAIYVVVISCVVPPVEGGYEDESGNWVSLPDQFKPLNWSMYLFTAVLVAVIVVGALLGSKSSEYDSRALTYGAVCVALSCGLLQFIQSPQFYQPMQALLDYPIAFGALGLAGIARNFKFLKGNIIAEFSVGATIAILLRYFSHVISGYFVFSSWAMEGYTAVSWAFVYNLFTIVDLAIVLVVGVIALSSRTVRRTIRAVWQE